LHRTIPKLTICHTNAVPEVLTASIRDVRFTPESRHVQCSSSCLLWANSGLMQCKKRGHSITSSARNKSDVGMDIPSA